MANETSGMNFTTADMDRLFNGTASLFENGSKTVNRIVDSINSIDLSSRRNVAMPNQYGYNPNQYGYGAPAQVATAQPVQYGYGYGNNSGYSGYGSGMFQMGMSTTYEHQFDGFWNPAYGMSGMQVNGGY